MKFSSTLSCMLVTAMAVSAQKQNKFDNKAAKSLNKFQKRCVKDCYDAEDISACMEACDFQKADESALLCVGEAKTKAKTANELCQKAQRTGETVDHVVSYPEWRVASGYIKSYDNVFGPVESPLTEGSEVKRIYKFPATPDCKTIVRDTFELELLHCYLSGTSVGRRNAKGNRPDGRWLQSTESPAEMREEEEAIALEDAPPLVRGFYHKTWLPATGPADTTVGITFCGAFPTDAQSACKQAPLTNNAMNWMAFGGGNDKGAWSEDAITVVSAYAQEVKNFGYDGVVIDAEISFTDIPTDVWDGLFKTYKDLGLTVCVTISHFAANGLTNGAELVANWLTNDLIDYLSPQLYTGGTEPANDWIDFNPAFATSVPKMLPSIVLASYYSTVPQTVVSKLPNSVGYIQWENTSPGPAPGPTPDCVSGTFNGDGCEFMCSFCEAHLGTDQYYWTTGVCSYDAQIQGCNGNPLANTVYTCCKLDLLRV